MFQYAWILIMVKQNGKCETIAPHSWYSYVVTIPSDCYDAIIEGL